MDVVVVESPAKAKTIEKYLGEGFKVVASYGHVRDLPSKEGSVRPDEDFAMEWRMDDRAHKRIKDITQAVRGAQHLYLATDPDREGEAISWHVREVLEEAKVLEGVDVKRVVFNEITRGAVLDAFSQPRGLDQELIDAYLARRALDYLVGFTLSPVLWRKLPGARDRASLSAGRVQSVALRLICEREAEVEAFQPQEYWSVKALFRTADGKPVNAQLTHLDGRELDKMSLGDEVAAKAAVAAVEARAFAVAGVERRQVRRNPAPPFTTSTLQQEASRKLGFSATRTMRVAQKLYEGIAIGGETMGLITYMRTDGVQMAAEAVDACRRWIGDNSGDRYLPAKPRVYKTKAKNAQEAHEAVRPTDVFRRPDDIGTYLDADQQKLYALIWKRTVASQMESAVLDQVAVDITSPDRQVALRATGSVVAFDGFLSLYREGRDDAEGGNGAADDTEDRLLPAMREGDDLRREKVDAEQHFTQPPPRFTEASLVKRLEELGIGRPSTYASILSVLQDRNYVRLERRRFIPVDLGRMVAAFLTSFFEPYVNSGFTADLEEKLDDISDGRVDWRSALRNFWTDFETAVGAIAGLPVKDVVQALDDLLGPHFFRDTGDGRDPRACPTCADGRLSLKLGKFGAFVGCSNYPDCRFTRPLVVSEATEPTGNQPMGNGPQVLGTDPDSGQEVTLHSGPYGPYVQLGEGGTEGRRKVKPKRASLPKNTALDSVDLAAALALLKGNGVRVVGEHPADGQPVELRSGRFGPYVQHGGTRASLRKSDDPASLTIDRAVALLTEKASKQESTKGQGKEPGGKTARGRSGRRGASAG